ncbi:connectin [Plutella xylostella]|uniref:connectin n=1 Tax=Plutella xylostella TaxID=51655 RepID=UPI002032FBF5|nr:connectin [Plutella xylostella]
MSLRIILLICVTALATAEAKYLNHHQKRDAGASICDKIYNNTNKVQCFCVKDNRKTNDIKSADCYLNKASIEENSPEWNAFEQLHSVDKLVFTTNKDVQLTYIPSKAIKHLKAAKRIDVKYASIKVVTPYSFANLSEVEEISLSDNQVQVLKKYSFAHHKALLTINLDTNDIVEINRDVFFDLPSLEKLFLTMNKITTIHDKAFVNLITLRELELDKNNIFSLNSETFAGLRHLLRLELSKNAIEVIGDNTFLPLKNLQYLNLEGNKIEMLDSKAFNGLSNLQHLSLALNKLSSIDSVNVFEGLRSLSSLSLRGNKLFEIKYEVVAPILSQFFGAKGTMDFEDNSFPCDCRLDWFMTFKNKTSNEALKLNIENLKCIPNAELSKAWEKIVENEKNNGASFEDEKTPNQNGDYEYYDDTQLEGKLFYIDIRDLLNCSKTVMHLSQSVPLTPPIVEAETTTIKNKPQYTLTTKKPEVYVSKKVFNKGILDLSLSETTEREENDKKTKHTTSEEAKTTYSDNTASNDFDRNVLNDGNSMDDKNSLHDDKEMASDEAVPDKLNYHRDFEEEPKTRNMNAATSSSFSLALSIPVLLAIRLQF